MGFGGNNKRSGPVGIAVNAHDVRLAQLTDGGGYRFHHEALAEGIDPASPAYHTETSRAIATAYRRGGFTGKDSVSALPGEMFVYKTLRLPPMPDEDLVQAIEWEAADRFKISDDQMLQHYRAGEVLQGNDKREEVILLAAEKQAVYDHAVALKRAGLNPIAIDATGAALARLLGPWSGSTIIIHLGRYAVEIVASRGEQVIFDKPVVPHREDGQVDARALAREISLCMRYLSVTFGIHKPDSTWVCGEGVTPELAGQFGQALNTDVQTVEQSQLFQEIDWPVGDASDWAVAVGLAQRGITGSAQRGAA